LTADWLAPLGHTMLPEDSEARVQTRITLVRAKMTPPDWSTSDQSSFKVMTYPSLSRVSKRYITLYKSDSAHIWSTNYMKKSVQASVRLPGRTMQQSPSCETDRTASSHRFPHWAPNRITIPIIAVPNPHLFLHGL